MFLSALQTYIVAILIAVIVLQYAFALFCLLKLAYFDLPKSHYILWNVFILVVFFIGGIAFLIYYYKHPEKLIEKRTALPSEQKPEDGVAAQESEAVEKSETETEPEQAQEDVVPTDDKANGADSIDEAEK